MKGKSSLSALIGRRLRLRLLLGLFLPFLFLRTAFLVLESAALCSTSIGCVTWKVFGGSDAALVKDELTRALVEASSRGDYDAVNIGGAFSKAASNSEAAVHSSFKDVVKDTATVKAFAFKTKAMIAKMERIVEASKLQESIYWHMAAHGIPKSLHCLSLRLAEEYAINAAARSRLPPPQYSHRLTDPSFHHIVLLTDNVLAASVVISSAVKMLRDPEAFVFHVVTDKKTYAPMHAWFAVNMIDSAVVEVKGLHQFGWSHDVNLGVKQMLEIHHQIRNHGRQSLKMDGSENDHKLHALNPTCISLLNHLRIYLPELFPDLNKVVFLDDDVVVQHDLASLWDLDLEQKVVGAVVDSWCGSGCCPGRKYKDYFNFTDPNISTNLDQDHCGWLYGVNIFDLERWRSTNITAVYHQWLKLNADCGYALWHPGALPPALLAFENQVQHIDPSWQIAGLGRRHPQADKHELEVATVVHFSGPAKPWLEIGSPEVRSLWTRHVNFSDEHIRSCGIIGSDWS